MRIFIVMTMVFFIRGAIQVAIASDCKIVEHADRNELICEGQPLSPLEKLIADAEREKQTRQLEADRIRRIKEAEDTIIKEKLAKKTCKFDSKDKDDADCGPGRACIGTYASSIGQCVTKNEADKIVERNEKRRLRNAISDVEQDLQRIKSKLKVY